MKPVYLLGEEFDRILFCRDNSKNRGAQHFRYAGVYAREETDIFWIPFWAEEVVIYSQHELMENHATIISDKYRLKLYLDRQHENYGFAEIPTEDSLFLVHFYETDQSILLEIVFCPDRGRLAYHFLKAFINRYQDGGVLGAF